MISPLELSRLYQEKLRKTSKMLALLIYTLINIFFYFFRFKKIKGNEKGDKGLKLTYFIYMVYIFDYGLYRHLYSISNLEIHLALTYIFFIGHGVLMGIGDLVRGDFYLCDLVWLFLQSLFSLIQRGSYQLIFMSCLVFLFFLLVEKFFGGFGDGDKDYASSLALACQSNLDIYRYLTSSFILAGVVALIGVLCLGWSRNKKLPLGPFLILGWIFVNILRWWKI